MCFGCSQDSRLTETVLLSTQNMCFGWKMRKQIFIYGLLFILSSDKSDKRQKK